MFLRMVLLVCLMVLVKPTIEKMIFLSSTVAIIGYFVMSELFILKVVYNRLMNKVA